MPKPQESAVDFERAGRMSKVFKIMPVLIRSRITSKDLESATCNETFWGLIHSHCNLKGT